MVTSIWTSKKFLTFAAGNTLNNVGDAIYGITLPLLIYHLTHSLVSMSIMVALQPFPLLMAPIMGSIVDRIGPRAVIVPSLLVQMLCGGLLIFSTGNHLVFVYILGTLIQIGGAFYRTGWMTSLPRVFPDRAPEARAALGTCYIASTIVGPLLVGALINYTGYSVLLWINFLTFLAPLVVSRLGVPIPQQISSTKLNAIKGPKDLLEDLVEGWRVLRNEQQMLWLLIVQLPGDVLISASLDTLIIFELQHNFHISVSNTSWILMIGSFGALFGSILASHLGTKSTKLLLLIGSIVSSLSILALNIRGWIGIPIALLIYPASAQAVYTVFQMLIYRKIDQTVLGRVNGLIRVIRGVPTMLSPLLATLLVDTTGLSDTYLIMAAVTLIPLLTMFKISKKKGSKRENFFRNEESIN